MMSAAAAATGHGIYSGFHPWGTTALSTAPPSAPISPDSTSYHQKQQQQHHQQTHYPTTSSADSFSYASCTKDIKSEHHQSLHQQQQLQQQQHNMYHNTTATTTSVESGGISPASSNPDLKSPAASLDLAYPTGALLKPRPEGSAASSAAYTPEPSPNPPSPAHTASSASVGSVSSPTSTAYPYFPSPASDLYGSSYSTAGNNSFSKSLQQHSLDGQQQQFQSSKARSKAKSNAGKKDEKQKKNADNLLTQHLLTVIVSFSRTYNTSHIWSSFLFLFLVIGLIYI